MARLVVFKRPQDVLALRALLYGDHAAQLRGLARCRAYEVRGPLPASVHTTCLLIAAVHGDVAASDLYAIRLQYAMALVRFVNETLDAAQTAKNVIPLHALAAQCGLPSAFVELRHASTHEDLPSVYVLREMCDRALVWLDEHFWQQQGATPPAAALACSVEGADGPGAAGTVVSADAVKEAFKEWRRVKREDKSAGVPPELAAGLRQQFAAGPDEFMHVVVHRNVLVPAGKTPVGANAKMFVGLWWPLFEQLGPVFLQTLAARVLAELAQREWPVNARSEDERRRFPVLEEWALALAPYAGRAAVDALSDVPRAWNARILAEYAAHHNDARLYGVAAEMAECTGATIEPPRGRERPGGWQKVENWTPRPIGTR